MLVASLGSDAILFELAALVSEPGAPRQPVHPDNPYQKDVPLVTTFIALQSVSAAMGPTTFLPGSHTAAVHAAFNAAGSERDALLQTRPCVVALLRAGDASCFDSRTLHCGGANANANQGGATRALLYFSFRNAHAAQRVGNVGSLRHDVKPLTLGALRIKLASMLDSDGNGSADPFDDTASEAEAARAYRQAADRGDSAAQFNLGVCYRRGAGVAADAVESVRWFREAAEQGLALAQVNLGAAYYAGDGVTKNDDEAARWFACAAEQGLPQAQQNIGWCYSQGVGVPKDAAQAVTWLQRAAGQGDLKAKELLGELLRELR
jgi:TPR repeat protein